MTKTRNLSDLLDANGDVKLGNLDNVPASNDASALTTGTLPIARIADGDIALAKLSATGTKDATTFLRGDNTFAALPNTGITMADQWRLTAGVGASSSADITANLEKVDGSGQGTLGTGMTESSGIFTFPSTGIYKVDANMQFSGSNSSRYCAVYIKLTTDNSTYNTRATNYTHLSIEDANTTYSSVHASTLVDVTNVSNVKVKFGQQFADTSTNEVQGNTDYNRTYFTFIRLGDT